jgi:hypothetical protein
LRFCSSYSGILLCLPCCQFGLCLTDAPLHVLLALRHDTSFITLGLVL